MCKKSIENYYLTKNLPFCILVFMIKRKVLPLLQKELNSDEIIVLTGMRRTGKTTLVRCLYDNLKNCRKVYLDLENPLNQTYFSQVDYEKVKLHLEQLAHGKGKRLVVFLDEIQNIKNLPSIVKYLYDHFKIKFILTGSASFYLKNLFSESLAGRKRIFELYPLDFEEFLNYKAPNLKKPKLDEKITKAIFHLFEKYISEYLNYGGFPSVVLKKSHQEKIAELDDIFTSYYQKEILLLSDFRKTNVMKNTIILLSQRVGSKLDIAKIASELGVSRITIQEYLDFLEQTYFIKRIRPFSKKIDVALRGQQKPYLCDSGMLTKMGKVPDSTILENSILNMLKTYQEIYFYQSKGGAEIDFLVKKGKKMFAFEVKTKARQNDINKLKRTSQKLGIKECFIISQNFSPLSHAIYPFQL